MLESFISLFTRLVVAVEAIAANGGGGFVAAKAEAAKADKPKKEKAEKAADPKPEEKPAPKKDPFADDDETPAVPAVTKDQVRAALTELANATDNAKALEFLAANTSNKAGKMGDIKAEDYSTLHAATVKAIAATKK